MLTWLILCTISAYQNVSDTKSSPALRTKPTAAVPSRLQQSSNLSSSYASASTIVSTVPQIDPSQCTIKFGGSIFGYIPVTIQTVDTTGQLVTTGGAKVEAREEVSRRTTSFNHVRVEDKNNGTYTFTCTLTYGPIHVKINGIPMKGSPFNALTRGIDL